MYYTRPSLHFLIIAVTVFVCAVPGNELVAVTFRTALQQNAASTCCRQNDGPVILLHTFKRKQFDWQPVDHVLEFVEDQGAQQWAGALQALIESQQDRPAHLFVVINPYGGFKKADQVWLDVVKPLFERARITCDAFRTGYKDHAVDLLEEMTLEQFLSYDGIVSVGGDGLFQECLRGLLSLRIRGREWTPHALAMRIGQIPAGSTDTISCTAHGVRSAVSSALHVIVGDRMRMDVLEVRSREGECRYSCSTTSYGFIGDVLDSSETMRWMGPARYDISGAVTFLGLKSYPVRLWYKPAGLPHANRGVCSSQCKICTQSWYTSTGLETVGGSIEVNRTMSPDSLRASSQRPLLPGGNSAPLGAPPVKQRSQTPEVSTCSEETTAPRCGKGAVAPEAHTRAASKEGYAGDLASEILQENNRTIHAEGGNDMSIRSRSKDRVAQATGGNGTDPSDSSSGAWFDGMSGSRLGGAAMGYESDEGSKWRCWEGEVVSLMVVVTPTRSEKTKVGLVPHAHIADGRMHLVIVRKCSRIQFFRFLIALTRGGVDERLPFVEVLEVHAWRMEELHPKVQASVWNVDGELMQSRHMSAQCHRGLVQYFGRGPEVG